MRNRLAFVLCLVLTFTMLLGYPAHADAERRPPSRSGAPFVRERRSTPTDGDRLAVGVPESVITPTDGASPSGAVSESTRTQTDGAVPSLVASEPSDAPDGYTTYEDVGLGVSLFVPADALNNTLYPGMAEVMFGDLSYFSDDYVKPEGAPDGHLDFYFMPDRGEYCLFRIEAYDQEKWNQQIGSGKTAEEITGVPDVQEIGRKDGLVYLFVEPQNDLSALDDASLAGYNALLEELPTIRDSVRLTSSAQNYAGDIPSFSTVDMEGNPVDQRVFSQKKLTMINIWATFCRPCIKELPGLEEISRSMPEDAQLISIVGDATDASLIEQAKDICTANGVTFTTIVPDAALKEYLDQNMVAYPTTLFVDSNGKLVGEVIVGERGKGVYQSVLAERLGEN